jgi:cytochrome c peroxidase
LADPRNPTLVTTVRGCEEPWDAERIQGAKLFHDTRDTRMTANRWMSCAVCHLEGGRVSDGLVWDLTGADAHSKIGNTMDLVNTPAASPPFFHRGASDSVGALEQFVRSLQQGTGFLPDSDATKDISPEWQSMLSYMNSMHARPSPHMDGDRPRPEIQAAAERGRQLFSDPVIGCVHCHGGPAMTVAGRKGQLCVFDVGTGAMIKTPSLLNLWDTAPYLHDGRAATLRDVLVKHNPQDRHGRTSHLNIEQLHDLETFLLAPRITELP